MFLLLLTVSLLYSSCGRIPLGFSHRIGWPSIAEQELNYAYTPHGPPSKILLESLEENLDLTYLGNSGCLISLPDLKLATAPFYSSPSLLRVLLQLPIWAKKRQIDQQLKAVLRESEQDLNGLKAILVGHSHYDHLMDVPHIVKNHLPEEAIVIGNKTAAFILDSTGIQIKTASGKLDPLIGSNGSSATIQPIRSSHAPHLLGGTVFGGSQKTARKAPPIFPFQWKEGQTYAYLIKLKTSKKDATPTTIYFQDAASSVPTDVLKRHFSENNRRLDIALLCVYGHQYLEDYPQAIIEATKARYVILIHWEYFFRRFPSHLENIRRLPHLDLEGFITALEAKGTRFHVPIPGCVYRFRSVR